MRAITVTSLSAAEEREDGRLELVRSMKTTYRGPLAIVCEDKIVGVVELLDVVPEVVPGRVRPVHQWVLADLHPVPAGIRFPYTGFLGIRDVGVSIERALLRAVGWEKVQ